MKRHSERHRQRISAGVSRWHRLRRERAKVRPRDLDRLARSGVVAPALQPIVRVAADEAAELFAALGGIDHVSEQKRILVEDLVAVGIALRGQLQLYLQGADGEVAGRIGTLAGARRASLVALGLERHVREVTLQDYLKQRDAERQEQEAERREADQAAQTARGDANGEATEAEVEQPGDPAGPAEDARPEDER